MSSTRKYLIRFKMKEIIDFNDFWDFQPIWTCFGSITRKTIKQFPPLLFTNMPLLLLWCLNPLKANSTKCQQPPTNCLSVFDPFVKLAFKELKNNFFAESPKLFALGPWNYFGMDFYECHVKTKMQIRS